uniref:dolichol kinase n=1 Tax=Timema douglasi TaxID=61478 RepID=A0A7R8Z3P2_TIMDO|nr:unnamed protein product [Timema douglasi]
MIMNIIINMNHILRDQLRISLNKANIITRPGADNGVWMGFILPLAVLVDAFKYPTASHTNTKASITVLSVGLLLGVVSTLISAIHPMQQTIGSSINLFTFMSSCLTAMLMFEFTKTGNCLLYDCQIVLVVYWIVCSVVAILAVTTQVKVGEHASTRVRKYFHLLALAVFIPGILLRFCLLYLASGVVLALFVILEVMRVLHMPPLGSVLNEGFTAFVDEKDCGTLALTPLYLLVGCSLPLWLHPLGQWGPTLHLLSGLLAVGVGDTAASVVGSRYGHYNWPGFMENSLGSFLKTTIAIVGTSLVEAKTDQVDNLALPLITYILLVAQS